MASSAAPTRGCIVGLFRQCFWGKSGVSSAAYAKDMSHGRSRMNRAYCSQVSSVRPGAEDRQEKWREDGIEDMEHRILGKKRDVSHEGPSLADFVRRARREAHVSGISGEQESVPCASTAPFSAHSFWEFDMAEAIPAERFGRRVYFETYGCQMNVNDLEIVLSILAKDGYTQRVDKAENSDVILINTCAIRDKAEQKVWHRLNYFKHLKQQWWQTRGQAWKTQPSSGPPKVAVLGCMAERLKSRLLEAEKMVDVVCGPDSYRDLPRLLSQVDSGQSGVNTMLSLEETYADVSPVRIAQNSISAFVSIMRGCDNMCSYCIVPFTRGRERSRPIESIVREVGELWQQGVKEVNLLGQNVNSYRDTSLTTQTLPEQGSGAVEWKTEETAQFNSMMEADGTNFGKSFLENKVQNRLVHSSDGAAIDLHVSRPDGSMSAGDEASRATVGQLTNVEKELSELIEGKLIASRDRQKSKSLTMKSKPAEIQASISSGFSTIYRPKRGGLRFIHLLDRVSQEFPEMRFRFTSPHPKDFPDELLELMRDRSNVCWSIHLPAQSGSTAVLDRMRRGYSREAYLALVEKIRSILPGVALSSDFITGFCGETEEDHCETLSLIEEVGYDMAYMFAYSLREGTHAHRNYIDDVHDAVKKRRLSEMIEAFRRSTRKRYDAQIGQIQLVLVEGANKRAPEKEILGKNDTGHRVIIPNIPTRDLGIHESFEQAGSERVALQPGDYVEVEILGTSLASLRGVPRCRTTLSRFYGSRPKFQSSDVSQIIHLK